jgi:hypothetical protein
MSKLLRVIPEVAGCEDNLAVAKNTYYLVVYLSTRHIRDFAVIMRTLEAGTDGIRFNAERFVLRRSPAGLSLAIPELEIETEAPPAGFRSSFGEEDPAVGCPALATFDGISGIRKLWDWHLDIASRIYKH